MRNNQRHPTAIGAQNFTVEAWRAVVTEYETGALRPLEIINPYFRS